MLTADISELNTIAQFFDFITFAVNVNIIDFPHATVTNENDILKNIFFRVCTIRLHNDITTIFNRFRFVWTVW